MAQGSAGTNRRFVPAPVASERMAAARKYVSNMDEAGVAWLYRKPFNAASPQIFFSEVYSILNVLQVLNLAEGDKVLEVGSGPGWVTEILALLGVEVTCIEPATDMIEIARTRLSSTFAHHRIAVPPQIDFIQSGLEEASLPDATFDAVIFHESLHHTLEERTCLQKAFRALKRGGRLAICEWCWIPGDYSLESSLLREMERFGTLESPFTQEYLDRLLAETGFVDITRYHSINGFFPAEHGNDKIGTRAQAPATRTNNLTAIRPYGCATSRERNAVERHAVVVRIDHAEWIDANRAVRVDILIENDGSTVLLNAGRGCITVSLCSGQLGGADFVEAGRVTLPRTLAGGERLAFKGEYVIPPDAIHRAWRLELVAEEVVWLDLASKPRVGPPSLDGKR